MDQENYGPCDGFLIQTADRNLQAYLQRYPYLTGPNESLNDAGLLLLRRGPQVRKATGSTVIQVLDPEDAEPTPAVTRRAAELASIAQFDPAGLINDYSWKISVAKATPNRILSFGCGDGAELLMLRTYFPEASILAIDWTRKVSEDLLRLIRAEFLEFDLNSSFEPLGRFDLVFSNHTLEHMYDPDTFLAKLRAALTDRGILVSALPLDGTGDDFFRPNLERWAAAPAMLGYLEIPWIDPGHPWKSNPSELVSTLQACGFGDVQVFQRRCELVRGNPVDREKLAAFRASNGRRHRWLQQAHAVLAPLSQARLVRRALFAMEADLSWGGDFKNSQSPEATFVAKP